MSPRVYSVELHLFQIHSFRSIFRSKFTCLQNVLFFIPRPIFEKNNDQAPTLIYSESMDMLTSGSSVNLAET